MKTVRLLTIGNSFAANALTYLPAIAASAQGLRLEIGRANLGGCTLEKHWNLSVYTEKQPEYKPYAPSPDQPRATLQESLVAQPWDFVTLQQASPKSWQRRSFEPFLGQLHAMVALLAPQAEILLHQTWAYRADAPYLAEKGLTQQAMFAHIRANFDHFGALYGCRVLPAGEAVQRARETPGHLFAWPDPAYDYVTPRPPALPNQEHSLNAGWFWAVRETPDGMPELRKDVIHLNAAGCFLIGCLWFECLTELSIHDAPFQPPELTPEYAAFLRDVAHSTPRQGPAADSRQALSQHTN